MRKELTELEGLFRVGEKIYRERGYVVIVALYGDGQVIYKGEETGLSLWEEALHKFSDWCVLASNDLSDRIQGLGERNVAINDFFLPVSLRADFIDCSK